MKNIRHRAPSAYKILKLLGAVLIRGRRLFEAWRLFVEIQHSAYYPT